MESRRLITKFEIPEYIREIQVSNKQRPKYYYWDGTTIKAKGKKLLQKYIDSIWSKDIIKDNGNIKPHQLKYPYFIAGIKGSKVISIFGEYSKTYNRHLHRNTELRLTYSLTEKQARKETEYILINIETKERVIANSTQAGKPKKIIIKGQDMYSGVLNEFTRAKIVKELKEDYTKKISGNRLIDYVIFSGEYPIYIELEIIDTIKNYYDRTKEGDGIRWDVGNRALPYMKTFVDFLVEKGVLIDDDRTHVNGEGYFFTPCNKHEDRKLIFKIYSNGML